MKRVAKLIKSVFIILVILFVSLTIFLIYSFLSITGEKVVKFKELENFKKYTLSNYEVDEIKFYFKRPSLYIEINSKKQLNYESIQEIKESLKPTIKKPNMDKISNKYWAKNSSLFYVKVLFNEHKDNIKTNYLDIELTERNGYKDWE